MEALIKIDGLDERLKNIEELIKKVQPESKDRWLNNDEFCALLNISHKTAQSYRDKGLITFSQIGNKIHYRLSAIDDFLDGHSNKKFNRSLNR